MTQRRRKLIGVTACVVFIIVYCLIAMVVAANHFMDAPGGMQLAFFAIAGLLWLPVPMALIAWMQRPDPEP